jgi:PAS domain S-box-containing protein
VQPIQILVIDDDLRHATSVGHLLDSRSYDLTIATDPEAGLERLQRTHVDVLLLDLNMPGLSGIDILKRAQPAARGIKTIVISGETDVGAIAPILRLGAYDYLAKPYAPEHLLSSVRNAEAQVRLERDNQRIQAEREASNRRHEFLVNASPDLIFMLDADGRFTFVNNQLRHVFDYAEDALLGQHWTALVDPALHDVLSRRFDERRAGGRATRHFEFDLGAHVMELSAMGLYEVREEETVFLGTYGIVRDVTEPRRTARVLAQSQRKFQGLFISSPDAMFISRLDDGTLIEANDHFAAMMAGLDAGDLSHDGPLWGSPEARLTFIADLNRSPQRHQAVIEHALAQATAFFEVTARKLALDGADCVMASVKDLTAQKQAERDRLQLETQLQQTSKMEAIGQLAGGIAHDFNNILASIVGYTELALASLSAAETPAASYLDEVVTASQRARDLISQMLTFTRASRGRPEVTALHTQVAEVSRMLRAAIPRSIEMTSQLGDELHVLIDPVQLQQVVINLLINARDAMADGGRIAIAATQQHARGTCASCDRSFDGDYVVLTVADTGHGIPRELQRRIFDMFVTTREPGRGTGIGLWLIHTIVHEYEGHVRIESTPAGSRFHILLPPAPNPEPTRTPLVSTIRGRQAPSASGRVLVIDDELSVAKFVGEVLRNAGYDALVFNDSTAARNFIRAHPGQIGLILTDQSMPQVNGFDIAAAARAVDPPLPVVMLSGFADSADARLRQAGIAQLIEKPFRIELLLGAVRTHTRSVPSAHPLVTDSHTAP